MPQSKIRKKEMEKPDHQVVLQEQVLVPIIGLLVQIVKPLLFYQKQEVSALPVQ